MRTQRETTHNTGSGNRRRTGPKPADRTEPRPPQPATQIDEMMDLASRALVETSYFEAASLAYRALHRARRSADFERMARIMLPLQEARRQIRQIAVDAAPAAVLVRSPSDITTPFRPGMYLLQPPLIAADARTLRINAERLKVPAFILTREPLTRDGRWPVVSVARCSVRTKVAPALAVAPRETTPSRDDYTGDPPVGRAWFESAAETLGDAAIEAASGHDHPWWRIDAALERLDALPDHEKLHQFIADQCAPARASGPPHHKQPPGSADRLSAELGGPEHEQEREPGPEPEPEPEPGQTAE